jgi:hypothetical protein
VNAKAGAYGFNIGLAQPIDINPVNGIIFFSKMQALANTVEMKTPAAAPGCTRKRKPLLQAHLPAGWELRG